MPRQGISYEDVALVCETLVATGENVTLSRVREKLGSGSMSTIMLHVNKWREGLPEKPKAAITREFNASGSYDSVRAEFEKINALNKAEYDARLAEFEEHKKIEILELENHVKEVLFAVESADDENKELSDKVEKLTAEKFILEGEKQEKVTQIEQLKSELQAERSARLDVEKEAMKFKVIADEKGLIAARFAEENGELKQHIKDLEVELKIERERRLEKAEEAAGLRAKIEVLEAQKNTAEKAADIPAGPEASEATEKAPVKRPSRRRKTEAGE